MKKILAIAALFASMAVASAQQFGVIGGLSLSTMDGAKNPDENKLMTLYQAGVAFKADLGAGFALQPTLTYQVKGASVKQSNDITSTSKTGFVELSVGAQWGPDLLAFRPYLFVEPYVGFGVTGTEKLGWSNISEDLLKKYNTALTEAKNKLEYGVGAGIGVEIAQHIQLSCQLFRNFGPLYKQDSFGEGDLAKVKTAYDGLKNYQGVKINLAILF